MTTTYFSGQKVRAGEFGDLIDQDSVLPLGIIARGNRTTSSTTTTTEVGVERLDDIPVYAGRSYKIWTSPLNLDSSVANDVVLAAVRYTTDGSTPSTSSTVLSAIQERCDDATNGPVLPFCCDYSPAADQLLSVLLSVGRVSGTGSVSIIGSATRPINLNVEDMGPDPGDTGVDI